MYTSSIASFLTRGQTEGTLMRQVILTADGVPGAVELSTEPTVQSVMITPEAAKELLQLNSKNRKLTPARVREHVETLSKGLFVLTNDAITIDTNGVLVNGQHRLTACVETGIPIPALLLTGASPEVREVLDTGARRSFAQALYMHGEADTGNLAASLSLHYQYSHDQLTTSMRTVGGIGSGPSTGVGARPRLSHATLLQWHGEHPEVASALMVCRNVKHALPMVKISSATVWYALASQVEPYETEAFYTRVLKGEGLFSREPENALRNWLIRADRNMHRAIQLAGFVKAWNAKRDNRELSVIAVRQVEAYPKVR